MTTRDLAPDTAAFALPQMTLGTFVAVSEFTVTSEGRQTLQEAFARRLGAVDTWPGFRGLQVWADEQDPTAFSMVSWWASEGEFAAYMGSRDHRESHGRIPRGEHRPRPGAFRRFRTIET